MIKFKPSSIALHIAGWLLFLSLPVIFIISCSADWNTVQFFNWSYYCLFSLFTFLSFTCTPMCYSRKFIYEKKIILYFLSLILLLTGVFFLRPFDRMVNMHGRPPHTENIMPGTPRQGKILHLRATTDITGQFLIL